MQLNHKLIPQRNINLRFNLSGTPQYLYLDDKKHLLENVYFSGLQDHYMNAHLRLDGKVDMLGICFFPEGFYPFMKTPVSEFKNQLLGADEVGFKSAVTINEKLLYADDVYSRLRILENELLMLLNNGCVTPENFRRLFKDLNRYDNSIQLSEFCSQHNFGMRKLERLFYKYVGMSARKYVTLNRFQNSLNQLLCYNYSKLSDIAFSNGYFDQTHFIKEFKYFTGNTPKNFDNQNNSILQIAILT